MRYGVFSDVHADLTAARETVELLRRSGAEALICLGDLVGYGDRPDECVEFIAALGNCVVIAGNHDLACIGATGVETFRPAALESVMLTRRILSDESRRYLAALPLTWQNGRIIAAHSSPLEPAAWRYVFGAEAAKEILAAMREQICFIGHTHYPAVARMKIAGKARCEMVEGGSFTLEENYKYLVNVGSAGWLRRKPGLASYAVFDDEEGKVEMFQFTSSSAGRRISICC